MEIKASELPEKIRGKDIAASDLVRITIETITPGKAISPATTGKMSAMDFIEAADRYEGTRGNGLDVAPSIRSARDEWD